MPPHVFIYMPSSKAAFKNEYNYTIVHFKSNDVVLLIVRFSGFNNKKEYRGLFQLKRPYFQVNYSQYKDKRPSNDKNKENPVSIAIDNWDHWPEKLVAF